MAISGATTGNRAVATAGEGDERETVAGLVHGLAVIQAFGRSGLTRMTQSEVSAATGLTRSTARRSLLTLKSLGYVDMDDNVYFVTPKVIELAGGFLNAGDAWIRTAAPYLESVRNAVEENVSAVVLDRTDVVYVSSFAADTVMALNVRIGGRKPAYCTAMGRVLLANLPEDCARDVLARSDIKQRTKNTITDIDALMVEIRRAREQGYAVVDQELEPGLIAVAVPIRNVQGDVLGAINICSHTMQSTLEKLVAVCLPEAVKAARRIAARLPYAS